MHKMLLASFHDHDQAEMALGKLKELGLGTKDLSVVVKEGAHPLMNKTAKGAASGATTGGIIGGIAGLLAGAGVLPALAGFLVGGPLGSFLGMTGAAAMTAAGAASGATAGGLLGALTNLGVSAADAEMYNESVDKGGMLFGVNIDESSADKARSVLESHQAELVRVIDVK